MKTKTTFFTIIFIITTLSLSLSAQTAHSVRNNARDASTEIDAVHSNPAGLVKLSDGLHISLASQILSQSECIKTTTPVLLMSDGNEYKEFKGKTNTIFLPSLQGAYKKGKWAFSGSIGMIHNGKTTFDNGLPSYELISGSGISIINQSHLYKANKYEVEQSIKYSNTILQAQLGGTYRINNLLSAYVGLKFTSIKKEYNGYLRKLKMNVSPMNASDYSTEMIYAGNLLEMLTSNPDLTNEEKNYINTMVRASSDEGAQLDVIQSGVGISPIIGVNVNIKNMNIGAKYEFKTFTNLENKTKVDDIGTFPDGIKTSDNIPALFSIGLSYQFSSKLLTSIGYHHIFESDTKKSDDRQEFAKGTNEFQAGLEYKLNGKLLFSIGGQISQPKVENEYQTELNYLLKSYTIGGGLAYDITEKMRINLGYQCINYSDYNKETDSSQTDVFSKKKTVIAVGIDYRF